MQAVAKKRYSEALARADVAAAELRAMQLLAVVEVSCEAPFWPISVSVWTSASWSAA